VLLAGGEGTRLQGLTLKIAGDSRPKQFCRVVGGKSLRGLKQVFESVELYDGRTDAEFLLTGSLDRLEEVDSERSVSVEVGISAKLQNVKAGNVMWSDTSFKTSEVNQRSLPAVATENVSRSKRSGDATRLVDAEPGLPKLFSRQ
jgi:hypothetical protein